MAARPPLLADDAVDQVVRAIGPRPGTQRLLHLRVEPLLGVNPSLHDGEIDASEGGHALQCLQLAERKAGVVLIHREQQHTAGASLQQMCPLEELDAVHARQAEVGCYKRHLVAAVRQPLEGVSPDWGESAVSTR